MRILFLVVLLCTIVSCKQKAPTSTSKASVADTTTFFQVNQFIQQQINEVNKTPYFIYKLDTTQGKKDSTVINNTGFNDLAKKFLQHDINDPSIKKYYSENVFFDETTKTYTISYATTNKDLVVQNVDVILKDDAKTVKRILIRKFQNYTDSSTIEQMSWKPDESFSVTTLVQKAGDKNETSQQTVVVWNEKG